MGQDQERAYDWNEPPIDGVGDGGYVLLPPGEYPFRVVRVDKGRHPGSVNLPPCNKAIVTVEIDGGHLGVATAQNNLFLHSKCDGFLSAFFKSIGLHQKGEPLRMDWGRATGSCGRCKTKNHSYNGKDYNDIDRFLAPETQPSNQPTRANSGREDGLGYNEPAELPSRTHSSQPPIPEEDIPF